MALVTPECFKGLSQSDQHEQLYEAVYDWAQNQDVTGDLVAPSCFLGLSNEDQVQQIYEGLYNLAQT